MFKRRAAPRKLPSSMAATKAVSDASFISLQILMQTDN
jgi:hypothetical protein